jgi:anti-anti-sigma factor
MKTVYIDGPLDAVHLNEVKEKIAETEPQLGDVITLDCTEMSYICSSGLRVFLQMHKDVTAAGGKLIIKGLQPLVKNVFDMTGFSNVFNMED